MSKTADQIEPCLATAFTFIYFRAVRVARKFGYAVCLHGRMSKDVDLLAVPWTDDAASAEELAEAIRADLDGRFIDGGNGIAMEKPHGRRAWMILMNESHGAVDLSIMPRLNGGDNES